MTMLFELPRRKPSISAAWALRVAMFVPVLALVSLVAHWFGHIETPVFLVLAALVALLCALALFLAMIGLRSLWVRGTRGGRRISWAIVITILVLAPYAVAAGYYLALPVQADVSSDLIEPPLFERELRQDGASAAALVAGQLRDGYPDIVGRSYNAPLDAVLDVALRLAEERGWIVERRRGRVGASPEIVIEFATRAPVVAIPVDVLVRLSDLGDTSFADIRVRMPDLVHDLGHGARLARKFLTDLDYAMIGIAVR